MQTESSSSVANKAFFSICLLIVFYTESLSYILSSDLQYVLFWSGVILLGLTIFPVGEGLIRVAVYIFLDRKLKKGTFTFWKTLNEPQWENFLNKLYGDSYLIGGFGLILIKIRYLDINFIDQSPIFLSEELTRFVVPFLTLLAMSIILTTVFYRINKDKLNISLTQFYLTALQTNGDIAPDMERYYMNKAWPLFQHEFYVHFNTFLLNFRSYVIIMKGDKDNFRLYRQNKNSIREIKHSRLLYFPLFEKLPILQILSEIEEKGLIINFFRENLEQRNIHEGGLTKYTNNNPEWPEKGSAKRIALDNAIEETIQNYETIRMKKMEITIDEQMIRSFYDAFDLFQKNLEEFNVLLEEYLEKEFSSISLLENF